MKTRPFVESICGFLFLVLPTAPVFAAEPGMIEGYVRDAQTGEPLPAANVILLGTNLGSASDAHGKYLIARVPPGTYTLRCTFIGYKAKEVTLRVGSKERVTQDFALEYGAVLEGKRVVVTAQAEGQMKAINQQLSAPTVVNIVSSARIQELPDANAAESIARLPGVSITRVGGEGTQVVIRGLAPKYNAILIDGVRMAASNPYDRSVDLSMISSSMLEGIEVAKTITADQDADLLGGAVNFRLREAEAGKKGLGVQLLGQGGYTGLADAQNKYNNYKLIPGLEGRFFRERLGLFVQANLERRNLSSNEFAATYSNKAADLVNYITQSINLHYIYRDRQRNNAAVVLDYRLPVGKISLSNFGSSGTTEVQNRYETFDINGNQHIYGLAHSKSTLNMMNNTLTFDGQLPLVHARLAVSHNFSETKNPDDWTVTFRRSPAGISQFANVINLNPKTVVQAALIDPQKTKLHTVTTNDNHAQERAWMTALDLDFPLRFSGMVSSVVKFGGKYRVQKRSYDAEVYGTNATFISPSARGASQMIVEHFGIPTSDPTAIPLSFFVDEHFSYGKFLDGDYEMHSPMQFGLVRELVRFCRDNVDAFAKAGGAEAFAINNYLCNTNDYSGKEVLEAAYVMATLNVGTKFSLIPGIRFQNLRTTYSGVRGQQSPLSYKKYDHTDTTVTVSHPFWLPNLNVRFRPLSWFDVRLSYSNTISYPDFNAIIPRIDVTTGAALAWNNYKLKPSRSKNYDVYFTLSGNKIGLFAVGAFLKQIDNLIYAWTFSKAGLEAKPYYLTTKNPAAGLTYKISTYINNPFVINDWGLEFDWQTHFWYLPSPLKGLVLNVNYTHVRSEAEYPYVYAGATSATDIDTSFTDRLLYQPNHILNLALGYDYRGFSIRFSMLYHDDVFSGVSQWPQLRSTTAAYRRWDISVKQKLPWFGLQLYGDVNNLNRERDFNVLQMYPDIPRSAETYGMTADIGLRWQL
ncbi:MAG: TonB-dependent receptor [candidate division KSB1 bacterium]|nr:TonB-dependent receptor [candidate division KSB1 bacterium]